MPIITRGLSVFVSVPAHCGILKSTPFEGYIQGDSEHVRRDTPIYLTLRGRYEADGHQHKENKAARKGVQAV